MGLIFELVSVTSESTFGITLMLFSKAAWAWPRSAGKVLPNQLLRASLSV